MAGSVTVTSARIERAYNRYKIDWTSDGSGNVSANPVEVSGGRLADVKFIPGTGGTQPTNLYDVTLLDGDGADLLNPTGAAALGTNLSNAAASWCQPGSIVEAGNVIPTVGGAGAAKTGAIFFT